MGHASLLWNTPLSQNDSLIGLSTKLDSSRQLCRCINASTKLRSGIWGIPSLPFPRPRGEISVSKCCTISAGRLRHWWVPPFYVVKMFTGLPCHFHDSLKQRWRCKAWRITRIKFCSRAVSLLLRGVTEASTPVEEQRSDWLVFHRGCPSAYFSQNPVSFDNVTPPPPLPHPNDL